MRLMIFRPSKLLVDFCFQLRFDIWANILRFSGLCRSLGEALHTFAVRRTEAHIPLSALHGVAAPCQVVIFE